MCALCVQLAITYSVQLAASDRAAMSLEASQPRPLKSYSRNPASMRDEAKVVMRSANEAEALLIARLKEAVAVHCGEAKPVRERVYSTAEREADVAAHERKKKRLRMSR
jgi:hypothetical protein